jgi:fibronectin-binding autotransporter adhesin
MSDRYWVGGTGTWNTSSTTNWSATSGGASGASVPTVADSVFFDQAGTYTVTMTGALACLDITVSAGTVTFATGTGPTLNIRGSMSLATGTVWSSTGDITFTSTSTGRTVTTNGVSFSGRLFFNGVGGYWTLGSSLTSTNASDCGLGGGTLDTAGYALTAAGINLSLGANTRTLKLNNSTVTLNQSGSAIFLSSGGSTLTFDAGTSQINFTSNLGSINNGSNPAITLNFYNVTFTSTIVGAKNVLGANTFNNLTVTGPASTGVSTLNFNAQQTINGSLSTTGTAGNRRVFFTTNTYGISVDLVVNSAPSLTDADFRGLYVRGTAAPISGTRIGNRGECRGITFSTPKTVYWNLPAGGNWLLDAWAASSGGSVNTDNFPLPQDIAVIGNTGLNTSATIGFLLSSAAVGTVDMSLRTNAVTFGFFNASTVYGDWKTGSGVTYSSNQLLTFSGGTTQTITSAGKTFTCPITVDTYGGTVQLADALNIGTRSLTVTNGGFNTAGYAVTALSLISAIGNVRNISFGASTLTFSSDGGAVIDVNTTNLTFNSGTSQINSVGTIGGGLSNTGLTALNLYNFTVSGTSGVNSQFFGLFNFNNLTVNAPTSAGIGGIDFIQNVTINGTLTCAGASAVRRIFLRSGAIGTPRTLTVNSISATDCDFRDITLAGAASGASPTRAGDCGGNTGITFPAPKTVYWSLAGVNNWGATAWATSSGGARAVNNFPLAQDTAVFDNAVSITRIDEEASWNVGTIDFSARTNAMTYNPNLALSVYGNLLFGTGLSFLSNPGGFTFLKNGGTQTITSNGVTATLPIRVEHPNAYVQLGDALTLTSNGNLTLTAGTFDAVTYNVTVNTFTNNAAANTIRMGSGTWTLSGTGTVWNFSTAPTVIAGTSNIVLSSTSTTTRQFRGGSIYYNKLTIGGTTGTSTLLLQGSNTFGELASTKTVAHTIIFDSGSTNTIGKWSITGTAGNVVTLNSNAATIAFTLSIAGPANSGIDYLSVRDCTVDTLSPGEFYVGANSTNVSNNSGVIFTATPAPRTLYWVGGTGNWSSTTKWSTSSGGGSGAAIPTSLDAVNFDALSNATAYTATIDAGVTRARCASFTMAGPLVGNVTFSGLVGIAFHGNVSFAATGITRTYIGPMLWAGNGSYTFTTNGLTLASATAVIGIGSTWTLGSALNITTASLIVTYGSFNTSTSNYSLTAGALSSNNSNIRSILLNASSISLSGNVLFGTSTNLTFSVGTSQINLSDTNATFAGGSLTFNNVSFTSAAATNIGFTGANTFNTLSFAGRTSVGITPVTFAANQTISTLTLNAGTSAGCRTFLASNTIGTQRTLNVTTLTAGAADIDFRDIAITGAAAPLTGTRFGDAKGNSGITFPAAKTVYYRQTGSANWGATGTGSWSATSGGSADATQFPLAQDTAVFPAATYPASGSTTTVNANYNIGAIDMSLRTTNTMTLATGTTTPQIYGNWINGTGTTLSGTGETTLAGRGAQTITSAGKTFTQRFTFNSPGGSITLQDALTSTGVSQIVAGTFDANNYNVTFSSFFVLGALTKIVAIGSGTWTLSNADTSNLPWQQLGTNVTITGTGAISLTAATTKTFAGGGFSYSGITLNQGGAGTLTISGNNTFKDITNTYSATGATTINLNATTQTLTNPWTATGAAGRVLTVSGASAASPGTLRFTGAGTAANVDYLNISNVRAYDLVDEWYAGANSTNSGSLGWYFIAAGGNVYAVTITETGTGTDAITAIVTLLGTISETGTGTDTVSSSFLFVGSVSETSTITDSNFAAFQPKANITETATGSDVESAILAAIGQINETATGTDTDQLSLLLGPRWPKLEQGRIHLPATLHSHPSMRPPREPKPLPPDTLPSPSSTKRPRVLTPTARSLLSETATGTEVVTPRYIALPAITETATGTDTDSARLNANSNINETATVTDAASAFATLLAAVSEAATATDLISSIKGLFAYIVESATITDALNAPGSTYNPSLTETATATDSITALARFAVQVAESANITDAAAAFKAYLAEILEAASGSDAVSSSFTARSVITETATGADTDAAALTAQSLISEAATGTETVSSLRTLRPSIAEAASGADAASTRNTTRPVITEAAAGADNASATATFQSQVAETSTAQDIVLGFMVIAVQVSESSTGSDQISALRALAAAVVEAVSGSDAVSATAVFQGILQEIATLTDSVNAPGSTYSAPVVELATLQDAVRAAATFPTAVTEAATGTEVNSAAFTPLAQITEAATVTDAASALAAFAARTAESANITDEVSPPGSIYNPVVLAVATMLDSVNAPGSIYNAPVLESATITDSLIGGYLWNLIDDSQTPSWGDVDDTQVASWVSVDDTQSVNWQNVGNTQTPGWTDVNDNQTPGWTPILP